MAFDPGTLNDKIGKLPVWVWGVFGGIAILGFLYLQRARAGSVNATAATATPATDTSVLPADVTSPTDYSPALSGIQSSIDALAALVQPTTPVTPTPGRRGSGGTGGGGGLGDNGGGGGGGGGDTKKPDSNPDPNAGNGLGTGTIENRASWRERAIAIAHTNSQLSLAYSAKAIDDYLNGAPLTETQANQVKKALAKLGTPPGNAPVMDISQKSAAAITAPKTVIPTPTKPTGSVVNPKTPASNPILA